MSLTQSDDLRQRACFEAEAQAAREQMLRTGEGFDAEEVYAYLKARITGEAATKPKAVKFVHPRTFVHNDQHDHTD